MSRCHCSARLLSASAFTWLGDRVTVCQWHHGDSSKLSPGLARELRAVVGKYLISCFGDFSPGTPSAVSTVQETEFTFRCGSVVLRTFTSTQGAAGCLQPGPPLFNSLVLYIAQTFGVIGQQKGCLSCMGLTWVQAPASHRVP